MDNEERIVDLLQEIATSLKEIERTLVNSTDASGTIVTTDLQNARWS